MQRGRIAVKVRKRMVNLYLQQTSELNGNFREPVFESVNDIKFQPYCLLVVVRAAPSAVGPLKL